MAEKSPEKYRHPQHSRLWMFKRPRSKFWWCGFHHQGKYLRTSTKTDIQSEAEKFAANWYLEKLIEIRTGVIPEKRPKKDIHTVKDASIRAVNHYRTLVEGGKKSPSYLKSIIRYLNNHILPYFENWDVRDIDSSAWENFVDKKYQDNPKIAVSTIRNMRNALAVCMKAAAKAKWIKEAPRLRLESHTNEPTKRVWFEPEEQELLLKALDDNVEEMKHTPHKKGAQELRDYVKFILYSGLRKGEAMTLTFANVKPKTGKYGIPYIMLEITKGKRGTGECKPDLAIMPVYKSILERRKPKSNNEKLFVEYHHEMFNKVLNKVELKFDSLGRKRDFISLRHTYISNKIRERVPVMEIALNCRTSPAMIEKHYAAHISPELCESLHEKENRVLHNRIKRMVKAEQEIKRAEENINQKIREIAELLNIPVEDVMNNLPAIEKQLKMIDEEG